LAEYIPVTLIKSICDKPAGFQYPAEASDASATYAPPIAKALAPTPILSIGIAWLSPAQAEEARTPKIRETVTSKKNFFFNISFSLFFEFFGNIFISFPDTPPPKAGECRENHLD
jgi:hypothetical protein